MEKLKPRPFCGDEEPLVVSERPEIIVNPYAKAVTEQRAINRVMSYVVCMTCACRTSSYATDSWTEDNGEAKKHCDGVKAAATAWNRRAAE